MKYNFLPCVILVPASLAGSVAAAVEVTPTASLTTTYTNNAQGFHANAIQEEVVDAFVGVSFLQTGQRVNANGDLNLGWRKFVGGHLPSEMLPSGHANVELSLIPDRLTWVVEDRFGSTSSRSFVALSESSRQDANTFRTGPDARFFITDRNVILASGRFDDTQFGSSDVDSRRYEGNLTYSHYLSSSAHLGVTYLRHQIDYTSNDLYPSTRSDIGFMSYTLDSQRTFFVVELGNESLTVNGLPSRSEPHVQVGLQRRVSPRVTFNVEYQHGFSDVSSSLRSDLVDRFQTNSDVNLRVRALPFTVDSGYAMLVRSGGRLLAAWQVSWMKEDYGAGLANFNRQTYGTDLRTFYALNTRWGLEGRARWVNDDSAITSSRNRYLNLGVGLTRNLSRSLRAVLAVEHSSGSGRSVLDDISETRVSLAVSYAPQRRGQPLFDAPAELRIFERGRPSGSAVTQQAPAGR
jgi:hypothetical protein